MAQLLVRNLHDEVVNSLKTRAKVARRSLQSEVKAILEEAATQNHATAWESVEQFRKRLEKSGRRFTDSAKQIAEDRDR